MVVFPWSRVPTATQKLCETQEMLAREEVSPVFGSESIVQLPARKVSANGLLALSPRWKRSPTATQKPGDGHEIPSSAAPNHWLGLGTDMTEMSV